MLDEIKTYLEDTEADKEAEAFLLSSQARDIADKSGVSLNDSKSLGDKNSSLANRASRDVVRICDKVVNERQRRKETLIQQLLKDKFEDAVGAPRESDTIQELVKLERALRDDGMAMESQRQHMLTSLKQQRQADLRKLSQEAERELQDLQHQKDQLELTMQRQSAEIEGVFREIAEAEKSMERQPAAAARLEAALADSDASDPRHTLQDQLMQLSAEHAQKMAENRTFEMAARLDQQQVVRGNYESHMAGAGAMTTDATVKPSDGLNAEARAALTEQDTAVQRHMARLGELKRVTADLTTFNFHFSRLF
jgi:hypothetical protein